MNPPQPMVDMHCALRAALAYLTREPTLEESALIRRSFIQWFGLATVQQSLFVGPLPLTLDWTHEPQINSMSHYVTFKVDGIAQLLFAPRNHTSAKDGHFIETIFFIDRTQTVRALDGIRFEYDKGSGPVLIDGELAFRRRITSDQQQADARCATVAGFAEGFRQRAFLDVDREHFSLQSHDLCYFATDCPVSRTKLMSVSLEVRLQRLRFLIRGKVPLFLNPHPTKECIAPITCKTRQSRQILFFYKPHQHGRQFDFLLHDVYPFLIGVPIDGFILTPTRASYDPQQTSLLFKLKPPARRMEMDAFVEPLDEGRYAVYFTSAGGGLVRWKFQDLLTSYKIPPKTVVELHFADNALHFIRERHDKLEPNNIRVAIDLVKAARDQRPLSYSTVKEWLLRPGPPSH